MDAHSSRWRDLQHLLNIVRNNTFLAPALHRHFTEFSMSKLSQHQTHTLNDAQSHVIPWPVDIKIKLPIFRRHSNQTMWTSSFNQTPITLSSRFNHCIQSFKLCCTQYVCELSMKSESEHFCTLRASTTGVVSNWYFIPKSFLPIPLAMGHRGKYKRIVFWTSKSTATMNKWKSEAKTCDLYQLCIYMVSNMC